MDKEKKKLIVVKRETRTNSENEPTRVYRPRTFKAQPVGSDESSLENRQDELRESTPHTSENSKENFTEEKTPSRRKVSVPDVFTEKKSFELYMFSDDIRKIGLMKAMKNRQNTEDSA